MIFHSFLFEYSPNSRHLTFKLRNFIVFCKCTLSLSLFISVFDQLTLSQKFFLTLRVRLQLSLLSTSLQPEETSNNTPLLTRPNVTLSRLFVLSGEILLVGVFVGKREQTSSEWRLERQLQA